MLLIYTFLVNIMYKIYDIVINIVNTLYLILFVLFIKGLFFVSAGAYIDRNISPINDKTIWIVLGTKSFFAIFGRITNISNDDIQQCDDFLA